MAWRWREADESVIRRLAERTNYAGPTGFSRNGWTGYDPGEMPESVWILHAMYERADGKLLETDDRLIAPPELKRLWWKEYAQRYKVPMVLPGGWPSGRDALSGWPERREYVVFPRPGSLDPESGTALLEHLVAFSPEGESTTCGAYFTTFPDSQAVYVGVLGQALDLLDEDVPDINSGPQNVWDLDETWIVYTDYDSWATRVSGPADLITRLVADERLETDPLPDVPKRT